MDIHVSYFERATASTIGDNGCPQTFYGSLHAVLQATTLKDAIHTFSDLLRHWMEDNRTWMQMGGENVWLSGMEELSCDPLKYRFVYRTKIGLVKTTAFLRNVGKTQLICSEFKKRPQGRRKYLACNDFKATPRQILMGYRLRWAIEIFHKHIKMFLGFEDVATKRFVAVESHVHWIYCAYLLMKLCPTRGFDENGSIAQKQEVISQIVSLREKSRVRQLLQGLTESRFIRTSCKRLLQLHDTVASIVMGVEGRFSLFRATIKLYRVFQQ